MTVKAYRPILLALFCLASPALAAPGPLTLRYLTPNQKVHPLYWTMGDYVTVNVKPPAVVLANQGKGALTVTEARLVGRIGEREVARYCFSAAQIESTAQALIEWKRRLAVVGYETEFARIAYGNLVWPAGEVTGSCRLAPGQSLVLPLHKLGYFEYIGRERVESLAVEVSYRNGGKRRTQTLAVPLFYRHTGDRYIYPLAGSTLVANGALAYPHHRNALSQEFGMDIVGAAANEDGLFYSRRQPPQLLTDHLIYQRDIMAVADGVVVIMESRHPEDVTDVGPIRLDKLVALIPQIGFLGAIAGNHVVIDHGNGDYSLYAHLSPSTIRVKVGERVKQGQVIAGVGNTGNSDGPHLHFQMMDGPDMLSSNCVPVMFRDVKPTNFSEYCREANAMLSTDRDIVNVRTDW